VTDDGKQTSEQRIDEVLAHARQSLLPELCAPIAEHYGVDTDEIVDAVCLAFRALHDGDEDKSRAVLRPLLEDYAVAINVPFNDLVGAILTAIHAGGAAEGNTIKPWGSA